MVEWWPNLKAGSGVGVGARRAAHGGAGDHPAVHVDQHAHQAEQEQQARGGEPSARAGPLP